LKNASKPPLTTENKSKVSFLKISQSLSSLEVLEL